MSATQPSCLPSPACVEPSLVSIPAAWFLMGSSSGQDCERPVHRVWLDAFLFSSTQVTNAEYATYLSATGLPTPPFWNDKNFNDPQQPVAGVSWFEADHYCQWLSSQTRRTYRLPSEAEWERAARGTDGRTYPWGEEPDCARANFGNYQGGAQTIAC